MVSCNQLIEYLLYPFDYTIPPVNIELHRTCIAVLFGGAQMQILGLLVIPLILADMILVNPVPFIKGLQLFFLKLRSKCTYKQKP